MTFPRTLLTAQNLYPKKQLGQYFLSDPSTADMIVLRSGILPDDVVLEIGAGLGALTIPLANRAKKVYAVEKDRHLIPLLKTELLQSGVSNVVLLENNIQDIDIPIVAKNEKCKLIVMGNLPYHLSSQILIQLIESRQVVSRAVLMFQKELALRMIAKPGGKNYGRLSAMLQYCAETKKLAEVKAHLFFPKPKVDSEVLEIWIKKTPTWPAADEKFLFSVIKAAFGQRRKTLKNALIGSELHVDARTARQVLSDANIDPTRRAESLSIEEFVKLSNTLKEIRTNGM